MIYKYILHYHLGSLDMKLAGKNKCFCLYKFTHKAVITLLNDLYSSSLYPDRYLVIQDFSKIFEKDNIKNISLEIIKNSLSKKGKAGRPSTEYI